MVKVTVEQGVLVGGKSKSENGTEYFEFLNIPYAKPPVGPLRFKSPQPPEPWIGERDAIIFDVNHVSFQNVQLADTTRGSEDCLYLNVYTPRLPSYTSKLLPVMVYIHGGAFRTGSGTNKEESGPDFLVEQDVLVVCINYRLGVFGFLSLGISEATGNMGLKDQTMALKWVQRNIHVFGGDKDQVTVLGISAGSASVEFHLLSPISKGLFQQAILQSGSSLNPWALNNSPQESALHLAAELGYDGDKNDAHSIYKFLMNETTESIGVAAEKLSNARSQVNPVNLIFVPTIEKDFGNNEAFLTESPYDLLKQGKFHKVKILRGFCEFESFIFLILKSPCIKNLNETKNYKDVVSPTSDLLVLKSLDEKCNELYNERYKNFEDEDLPALHFYSDFAFTAGIHVASQLMEKHAVPIYYYMFAYDGKLNLKHILKLNKKGAGHGDDLNYIMKRINPFETIGSDQDKLVRKRMVQMLTNFIKTGNPISSTDSELPIKWPQFYRDEQKYLVIDKELQIEEKYEPRRMALFEELYEKRLI